MADPHAGERDKFARLRVGGPIWAIASIHGEVQRR